MSQLALFDLDHTLINVDSDHSWGQFIVEKGLVDEAFYKKANDDFYQDYIKGVLDPVKYNEFVASFLKQHPMSILRTWQEEYLQTWIVPAMRPKAIEAINHHKNQGDTVLVVSATNDFVVVPIAQLFGVDKAHTFATRLQVVDNAYTGKVADRPNFKEGKLYHLNHWLNAQKAQGKEFEKIYAYSDSKNDLPLLEWADVAICVTPDEILAKEAARRGWQVVDWAL
ncbi:MAG: HAD family hydrolase [Moraxella sp.]|nr:HAD family hydrolase [Moraxella sp.]